MDGEIKRILANVAQQHGTPSYVYLAKEIRQRVLQLREAFGERFEISYAAKANPNTALLKLLQGLGLRLDVSSVGEMQRGLNAGFAANDIGFTGPAKREFELRLAIRRGIGEIICESPDEIEEVNAIASELGIVQPIVLRINPSEVPRKFGLQMAGRSSQFGIDEENLAELFPRLAQWSAVRCIGFHAFSVGNSLDEEAVIENLSDLAGMFTRFSGEFSFTPQKFIFGSGFGIPYFDGDEKLDVGKVAAGINPLLDGIRLQDAFRQTVFGLEMGRWLVGTAGYMLTSVVRCKSSRGREIRMCDAGFNNHLNAAGMMGTIMRRDWRFWNLDAGEGEEDGDYMLVGPLCASFDVLGSSVSLPRVEKGDVIAVGSSGAYGLTASPTRFISHPEPGEYLVHEVDGEARVEDVTESSLNHPESLTITMSR